MPKLTAFHNYGFNNIFTAGLNLQLDIHQQLIGAKILFATIIGTFGLDFAVSNIEKAGPDIAALLQYRFTNLRKRGNPVFFFSAMYTGPHFGSLGNIEPSNKYSFDLSGNSSLQLPFGLGFGVGARYRVGREPAPNVPGFSIMATKAFSKSTALRFSLNMNFPMNAPIDWQGTISLTSNPSELKQSITVKQEIETGNSSISWNKKSERHINGINLYGGIQGMPFSKNAGKTAFINFNYPGYRLNADLSESVTQTAIEADSFQNRISLRLGTALTFAGGKFAISAPISDSFAIISPQAGIKGKFLGVNQVSGNYSAKTDFLGLPVLSALRSYYYERVTVESPDLPPGYDLGTTAFTLIPAYKSGTLVSVGTDAIVYAGGTLVADTDEPIPLQAGEVVSTGPQAAEPILFFTDRTGGFMIYGLKPGLYDLYLYLKPESRKTFSIEDGVTGYIDLGRMKLSFSENKNRQPEVLTEEINTEERTLEKEN
ncbi:MAG: hypothetical protein AB1798_10570 [Spirochaetota bacterium]